ncbi:SCO family protein [Neoehrlichia mikurensis]|uniref:SCO family protein n=1 Tax=Neoehrlichia mikurensis TaxID=89586 RepID=A0A9Q9F3L5_9RICK|nr:SCO family protein [Neoehrlichia mikurensis]QXK92182.1 SCO family protein [Neoehrlichia mikurensis]QXK92637.1 SCO family protein [Neoehrlichia mikurensis]QXK93875.1 SCO family protein [Neoehrlichia mikurensis]UTO55128.1 SCO family protein [Neoehrlichia mikurensis]UTO56048.1 SCO family protein [Neoehrlichia mikurensis]
MKIFKILVNTFLLLTAVFLVYSYTNKKGIFNKGDSHNVNVNKNSFDTSFNLINQEGINVSSKDFAGKYMLVMFGFSSCHHICPAELGLASELLNKLGTNADKIQIIFITIDPEKDTVSKLKEYHKGFDSRIQMLTGSTQDINKVAENYKIYIGSKDSDQQIAHSSLFYLIDKNGDFITHFAPDLKSSENQSEKLFLFLEKYLVHKN